MLWIFFNEIIEYIIMSEKPTRFLEKIIRIRIINKICYPLISKTINTECANVVDKVWTDIKTTWKCSTCVANVDNSTNENE